MGKKDFYANYYFSKYRSIIRKAKPEIDVPAALYNTFANYK